MGGKQRSTGVTGADVLPFFEEQIQPGLDPVQTQLFQQIGEALRTGGVGAQIPIIQQAVSQSRSALGTSLQQSSDELARTGLLGTPFGQRQLAGQRQAGEQQIAGIPTQGAQQLIGQAPQLVQGLLQALLGSLAGAGKQRARAGPFNT